MDFNEFETEFEILLNNQIHSLKLLQGKIEKDLFGIFKLIISTNKKIIFSGVGKSGHIGKKATASFSSTGVSSIYLEPLDAMHGDLGMVEGCGIAILISHSGNTKELIALVPSLKKLGLEIVSITSNPDSKLANLSDYHINTRVEKENCPHNLAPTISTTTTLFILDALMVLLMKEKKFNKEDFALYHPAGALGKRLLLKVENIAKTNCETVDVGCGIVEVIDKISKIGKGLVPIVEKEKFIGVITDGDLRRALEKYRKNIFDIEIKKITTFNSKRLSKGTLCSEALGIMENHNITALPIIEKGKVYGIVNIHDILDEGIK